MDHSQLAPLAPRSGLARYSSGGVGSTGAAALVHFLRTTRRSLRAAACRTRKEHQDAPARLVVSVDFWQSRRARATGHDSAFACRLRRGETRPGARAPNFAHLRAIFSPDLPGERFGRHAACEQLRAGACASASQLSCSCPVGWMAAPDRQGRKNRREGAQEGVAPPRMRVWAPHLAPGLALCTSEQGSTARAAPARSASSLSTRSSSSPHGRAGFTKFRVLPDNGDS